MTFKRSKEQVIKQIALRKTATAMQILFHTAGSVFRRNRPRHSHLSPPQPCESLIRKRLLFAKCASIIVYVYSITKIAICQ